MSNYRWAVVGAGPAGIAAVGRLLDHGVAASAIVWIDPQFTVGDFGAKWRAVPSNTTVGHFLDYLTASPAFGFSAACGFALSALDPQQTCTLAVVAEPLQWITERLGERVRTLRTVVTGLTLRDRRWTLQTETTETTETTDAGRAGAITADNVVLAIGSVPTTLADITVPEIPVETVLDPHKLAGQALDGATVGVFGSSHSAMIALPNLLDTPVATVINFYRSPLRYAVALDDWTVYDDTGLKGRAACWARENIDGVHPERLRRCHVDDPAFDALLRRCDRVVHTVGFRPRTIPSTPPTPDYDPATGILAPGLFGLGIAFPEYWVDPLGSGQYRVGLRKFMQRLETVLPLWLRYGP
ncbi:FAD-dependent oxidoreductase [Mycolicibacillus parakoreensis]|uniref:FAD/NAD(P)-binding protein n=1 Tax=Mycolicibacillus parakoreensis TaxID=1069221 RepID=A0ABY3U0D4_9MYCO|nr:FAD/NAD(P)-binding protein [Mycolicibacillus parakoreensis]MCV7315416.1 FAD-dependent oxidoreductase [Mycolicibacillus parakoreensis]ULN52116.1 FAD/NAD(P)-binding protein [Mycolicibacillus parakoreensis]